MRIDDGTKSPQLLGGSRDDFLLTQHNELYKNRILLYPELVL